MYCVVSKKSSAIIKNLVNNDAQAPKEMLYTSKHHHQNKWNPSNSESMEIKTNRTIMHLTKGTDKNDFPKHQKMGLFTPSHFMCICCYHSGLENFYF